MKKKENYTITWKKFFGHLHTINKHRVKVLYLCFKAGIPWQGLIHDLSKYSPIEFFEGVKYYSGNYSPIHNCKQENGYSKAWLHHKGRNKHHYEYWYDYETITISPVIPYKYVVEMICDSLAAGIIYQKKNWTKDYQLNYWIKTRSNAKIHPAIDLLLTKVYQDISKEGIEKVLNKKNLTFLYNKYVNEYEIPNIKNKN